jgi:hypothetical protein
MKTSDLSELRNRIAKVAKDSHVGKHLQDVHVEAEEDTPGAEFLRVTLSMDHLDDLELDDLEPLIRSIEDDVAKVDDRYPSVRFAEAA